MAASGLSAQRQLYCWACLGLLGLPCFLNIGSMTAAQLPAKTRIWRPVVMVTPPAGQVASVKFICPAHTRICQIHCRAVLTYLIALT